MKDLTETNYFDKPEDNILVRYLPHIAVMGVVMVATGIFYSNLMYRDNTRQSDAAERYNRQIPVTLIPSTSPSPTPRSTR